MDFDPMSLPPVIRAAFFTQMALADQVRLAAPQADYVAMQQQHEGGLMCPMDGIAVSFGRETTDYVLRHHELFSSAVDMPSRTSRPARRYCRRSALFGMAGISRATRDTRRT